MIKRNMRAEEKECYVQGEGTTYLQHILEKEELCGHGRLYAKNILPPGASIGWHVHHDEFEIYYILKGTAVYEDCDRSVSEISEGTATITGDGQGHSIANHSDEDVEFTALILSLAK